MRALVVIALAASIGCGTDEAVFELSVEVFGTGGPLPYAVDPAYLVVEARRDDSFAEPWNEDFPDGIRLTADSFEPNEITLVTDEPDADVHVKVRICGTPDCSDAADAMLPSGHETWLTFQRPFYAGEQTFIAFAFDPLLEPAPPEINVVEKCEIRGCTGEMLIEGYCDAAGRHLCE